MFEAESGEVDDVAVTLKISVYLTQIGRVIFVLYEPGSFFVADLALGYRKFANGHYLTVTLLLDSSVHYM